MRAIFLSVFKRADARILLALFVFITLWRLVLIFDTSGPEQSLDHLKLWGATYQVIALVGAISGLLISRHWGGLKSIMGRAIIAFSLGLFFQVFGQSVYSFYNIILHQDILYPSIGDIGFFGSIPLYIYGVLLLARACGVSMSLRSLKGKMQAAIIPLIMLGLSYYFFLTGYEFDWSEPIRIFLDFGYPLGQAMYVALAILTYTLSKKFLGGIMRGPSLFILAALVVQYICDYTFLFISSRGTWVVASFPDYMYMISYMVMSLSLLCLGTTLTMIRSK